MWIDSLFPDLSDDNVRELERFQTLLKKAWPLKDKHRQHLKYDIRDMSRALTIERSNRRKEYMTDAKFLSPYLCYFLPWNLYRMSRLFTGLELDVPENGHVADLGAGPLTTVLALWMARPHLRTRKLNFTCLDLSTKSMQIGHDLFTLMAGKDSPWRIKTVKGVFTDPLHKKADLLFSANALNELDWSGRHARPQAAKLAHHMAGCTSDTGRILLIETGVRLTGRVMSEMRAQFLPLGYKPIAPCPHEGDCPMPGLGQNTPWCHFNFSTKGAPAWLEDLSQEAKLPKDKASMNFLYLSTRGAERHGLVRAVSEPFNLHGLKGQYGCSERGLTLLEYRKSVHPLFPGQGIMPDWPAEPRTDLKTQATILPVKASQK